MYLCVCMCARYLRVFRFQKLPALAVALVSIHIYEHIFTHTYIYTYIYMCTLYVSFDFKNCQPLPSHSTVTLSSRYSRIRFKSAPIHTHTRLAEYQLMKCTYQVLHERQISSHVLPIQHDFFRVSSRTHTHYYISSHEMHHQVFHEPHISSHVLPIQHDFFRVSSHTHTHIIIYPVTKCTIKCSTNRTYQVTSSRYSTIFSKSTCMRTHL